MSTKNTRSWGVVLLVLLLVGCTSATKNPERTAWTQMYESQDAKESTPSGPEQGELSTDDMPSSTLPELLVDVEERNLGLRAAYDRWTAALEQIPQATALPDPRISYAYFITPVETRVGPQRQRFSISQTIPLFGKLGKRGDIAIHAANVAGAQFESERWALRLRVTRLWNNYYYLGRSITVTEENVRLMTHLERVALAQYAAGKSTHAAAIRAQVELGKLEDRLRTLRDQRQSLVVGLNVESNRPVHNTIPWPDSLEDAALTLTSDQLRQLVANHNPQLAGMRAMAARDSAAADLAGKSAIPSLTVGAEYIDTGPAVNPNMPDSGKNAAIAMASVNVPLWFGQYRAEHAQANARRTASVRELAQLHNRLHADLERAQFEYRDADRRVELYAFTLLPKARQSFEVTEDAFTSGDASFLDLVDAQRPLLEFELSYERALADRLTTLAQLEGIIGQELIGLQPEGMSP
jgi:outer membrane protein TolC